MHEVERGDIVYLLGSQGSASVAAIVVQSTAFSGLPSLLICPLTDEEIDAPLLRVKVHENGEKGLPRPVWAMVELLTAVPRDRIGRVVGRVDGQFFRQFDRAVLAVLGIA